MLLHMAHHIAAKTPLLHPGAVYVHQYLQRASDSLQSPFQPYTGQLNPNLLCTSHFNFSAFDWYLDLLTYC